MKEVEKDIAEFESHLQCLDREELRDLAARLYRAVRIHGQLIDESIKNAQEVLVMAFGYYN
jgi:hypothetical protein